MSGAGAGRAPRSGADGTAGPTSGASSERAASELAAGERAAGEQSASERSAGQAGAHLGDRVGHRLVPDADLPGWMRPVVAKVDGGRLPAWVRHATEPAPEGARRSAVLMLLGQGPSGPDLLLTGRASTLRRHAGQPAFPGGALDPGEDEVTGALREGREETGLDPDSVTPAAVLPRLYLRPSGFVVRPVLALWRDPGPVGVVDPAETAVVARVPVSDLADPAHRGVVTLRPGLQTPAFTVAGLVVWGFTAGLVDLLLEWGGWSVPWDRGREIALDDPILPRSPTSGSASGPPAGTGQPPGREHASGTGPVATEPAHRRGAAS